MKITTQRLLRIAKKPPHIVLQRIWQELLGHIEKYYAPYRQKTWTIHKLLQENRSQTLAEFWQDLGKKPFFSYLTPVQANLNHIAPDNITAIITHSNHALQHRVNLLGTGLIDLGENIDWQKDYKTNISWPKHFFKSIEYANLDQPSDVKIAWEISRLQWLIPCGQAYLITKDEKYAQAVKKILIDWIQQNPYAFTVNWACTMEVAIRIIVWTWFFQVFWQSESWLDQEFQQLFLTSLYLHGDFTRRHLELSDINGNHYITDAAGLVCAGLFFSDSKRGNGWQQLGWKILNREILLQVSSDGVDFEGSTSYQRLVTEIFLLPALYRLQRGQSIPLPYQQRLIAMAEYIAHYSRQDGSAPIMGDADDGRILPFGEQVINDHRYLIGLIAVAFKNKNLASYFSGSPSEIYWYFGEPGIEFLNTVPQEAVASRGFNQGGYYVMRNATDHIFIDCAPVGLGGRGGHGHNDCLSFEAILDNQLLLVDSGTYTYTGSPAERNWFRSTAAHNIPVVDGVEINRFINPNLLWALHDDAKPTILSWENNSEKSIFRGSHHGYAKLKDPVTVKRSISLNHLEHILIIEDQLQGIEAHEVIFWLHFHPTVQLKKVTPYLFEAHCNSKIFLIMMVIPEHTETTLNQSNYSVSYGKKLEKIALSSKLSFQGMLEHIVAIGIKKAHTLEMMQKEIHAVRQNRY